jgi:hypothetical protein
LQSFDITYDMGNKTAFRFSDCLWLIPGVILLPLLTFGTFGNVWKTIGVPTTTRKFADLYVVTSAADCIREYSDWSMESLDCTPLPSGMIFNYPPVWAEIFHALSFHTHLNTILGYTFSVVFIFSILLLSWSLKNQGIDLHWQIGFVLVAISPSTLFVLERGNIDIIIFVGLVLIFILLQKHRYAISAILGAILGTLKIYPFGIGLMWIISGRKHRKSLLLFISSSLLGVIYLFPFIPLITGRTGQLDTLSFGSSQLIYILNSYLEANFDPLFYRIIGTCLLATCSILTYLLFRKIPFFLWLRQNHHANRRIDIFIGAISIYVFTFSLGNNFNYRLIIGILLVYGIAQLQIKSRFLILYVFLVVIACWIALFRGALASLFMMVTWGMACLGSAILINIAIYEIRTAAWKLKGTRQK